MRTFSHELWKWRERRRLAAARLRSHLWRWRGAEVGAKCLFGHGVRIDRPWTARFGTRCVLEPDVWFDTGADEAEVVLGDHVFVGRGTHLLTTAGVSIGDHCLIGDGVILSDHRHAVEAGTLIGEQGCEAEPITIGRDVLICVRAIVLQGVSIGDGAIIGPGATVTTDVKANAIVGSPPARVVAQRRAAEDAGGVPGD